MKICIIKLGALGDVVRTIPVAKAIYNHFPNSKIVWITKSNSVDIIKNQQFISRVISLPYLENEKFALLYNFDIDDKAITLANEISAEKKYGFYSNAGYPSAFNLGAEYYLNTLFDDEIKKTNTKTYQEMMFDLAELPYKKENIKINLDKSSEEYAKKFVLGNKIKANKLIGIHMGASPRWPSKVWHKEKLIRFIIKASSKGYETMLFAGPNEIKEQQQVLKELLAQGVKAYSNNPQNTILQFASLVNFCKAMVCSDSFALHMSIALGKPTIGLFFCTSPHEVESYGLLKKIASPKLKEFFPERMDEYNEELTKSITEDEVLSALEEIKRKINKNIFS